MVTEDTDIPQKLYSLPLRVFNGIGGQMEAKLRRHGINKVKSSILKIEPSYAPFGGVLRVMLLRQIAWHRALLRQERTQ